MSTSVKGDRPQVDRGWRMRGRRLWFGLVVALLTVMAGYFTWQALIEPARAARRPFVGTWRLESPVFPKRPELAFEIDLLLDGAVRDRIWNLQTGAVELEQVRPGWWEMTDGRVQEFIRSGPLLGLLGEGVRRCGWDHRATLEGPDRLRLEDPWKARPTMVWVRSRE